jgi:DNA-binding GntR family transcriptional regulator
MSQLYLSIRQAILDGTLQVGQQLVEASLAQKYEVSRTPVREALRRLEQDGLLERSPRGGLRVKVWTSEEMFDLYELRIVLEAEAARWAAERRTRLDLVRLRQANDEMQATGGASVESMRETNFVFHQALWHASHNKPLTDTLERLQRQIMRHPASTLKHPGRWEEVVAEHTRMIDAIEAGGGEEAARLAASHMTEARDLRLSYYLEDTEHTEPY